MPYVEWGNGFYAMVLCVAPYDPTRRARVVWIWFAWFSNSLIFGPWLYANVICDQERGSGYNGCVTVKHFFLRPRSYATMCPGAEAVRGWRCPNCSTVCTVGAVAPGAGF